LEDKKFLWGVEVNEPPTEKRQWVKTARYMVVATDMDEAIKLTKERHPDVTLIKVMRDRSVQDVLIQGE
jgi:hypothetical protein